MIVASDEMSAAVSALEGVGYVPRGDLGVTGREVLQQVLAASGEFTEAELRAIRLLNDPDA